MGNIDLILIKMALCEFMHFPSIPTRVSINEYIEISKDYSSQKSSFFINGVLDKIIKELPNIKISGTRRTIAKVLMLHTIPAEQEGRVLDFCITMIETPKEPVAVKSNCMTIIFNLLPKYPELRNEIFAIIEDQIPHNTDALKGRYNVLRKQFKL